MRNWYLDWEPGSRFVYHPTSAHWVLAEIIERVSGRDYREYANVDILGTLGLEAAVGNVANLVDVGHRGSAELLHDQHGAGSVQRPPARSIAYNPGMSKVQVVLCTFPDPQVAAQAARTLVSERLAACANLVPTIRSIYEWEGELKDDAEALAVIKTTAERFPDLEARLAELHPYDVPEILALDVNQGHDGYLRWVADALG